MKKLLGSILIAGLLGAVPFTVYAQQPDTLTKPGRTFKDPKATDDNSKVLIDTSSKVVDSLLDNRKIRPGMPNHQDHHYNVNRPKKAPADTARRARP